MNKNRFFKRLSIISLALVLVCTGVIALTGAYFTSSSTVAGVITMGKVAVHFYDAAGTTNVDGSTTGFNKQGVLPGDSVLTPLTIKASNTELNTPVYLRLTMFIPTDSFSKLARTNSAELPGADWNRAGTTDDTVTISSKSYMRLQWHYYKNSKLTVVSAETINSGIKIFETPGNLIIMTSVDTSIDINVFLCIDAVQATNVSATIDAFSAVIAPRTTLS